MKRRDFFKKASVGSAAIVSVSALSGAGQQNPEQPGGDDEHDHKPLGGSLASAVVSFGQWRTDLTPPLDRLANQPPPPPTNNHQLLPFEVTIRAGGSVMFVIAGLHQILVYDDGTRPEDISTATTTPTKGVPAGLPLIDFPTGRIYRGPDPSLLPSLDRTEAVHFPEPGRYLVICGIRGHFVNDDMFGYVQVVP
jgi:plastocyanin